jgi:hypothetical protein
MTVIMPRYWAFAVILVLGADQDRHAAPPDADLIDGPVAAAWLREGIKPGPPSDDASFLRRVHLDILGVIPPLDVVERFLSDRRPDRRARLVEELLSHERYGRNWAGIWEALLIGYDYGVKNDTGDTLLEWLRADVFAKNLPLDEMFRRLVTASGIPQKEGPAVFPWKFMRLGGTTELSVRVARVFLGAQIQCAQCHDHPFDKWTQEDFQGINAFFVRLRQRKAKPDDPKDREILVFEAPQGEAFLGDGKSRRAIPPRFLDGAAPGQDEPRREALARLASRPENLAFSRALVNRMWAHFFGRGLVHPVEEMNDRNRPSHPELLDALAREFAARGFDPKWLIRKICASRTYQLSSQRPRGIPASAERFYPCALTRAMSPDELFDSLVEATGSEGRLRAAAKGRALEAVRRDILRQFRFTFGDDENTDVLDFQGTIPQALLMLNGELIQRGLVDRDQRLDLILRTETDPARRLELIFKSALSRPPTGRERARYLDHVAKAHDDRAAYEDVFWTLLNSSEFLFSH